MRTGFGFQLCDHRRRAFGAGAFGVFAFVADVQVSRAVESQAARCRQRRGDREQALVLGGGGVYVDRARAVDVQVTGGVDREPLDFFEFFGFFGFFPLFHRFFELADDEDFLALRG